jgi:hypothetical protein
MPHPPPPPPRLAAPAASPPGGAGGGAGQGGSGEGGEGRQHSAAAPALQCPQGRMVELACNDERLFRNGSRASSSSGHHDSLRQF